MIEIWEGIAPLGIDEPENGNPELPINGFVLQALAAQLAQAPNIEGETPNIDVLSSREAWVLGLISQGLKNQTVGDQLNISPHTVKNHLTNIYKKLGLDSVIPASNATRIGFRGNLFSENIFTNLPPAFRLSLKEHETLCLISEGLANAEIAEIKGVSTFTVYSQVRSILNKLHAKDRTHATRLGLENGLIDGLTVNERELLRAAIPFMSIPDRLAETSIEDTTQILDEKSDLFLQGEGTEEKSRKRYGMYTDWVIEILKTLKDRPLSYNDLSRVLYEEEYNQMERAFLNSRSLMRLKSETVRSELNQNGLKFQTVVVSKSGRPREVRVICTDISKYILPENIDESLRPTDNELKGLAARLRQEELKRQKGGNFGRRKHRKKPEQILHPTSPEIPKYHQWERPFGLRVMETINRLSQGDHIRGIKIKNPDFLMTLFVEDLINEDELKTQMLSWDSAVIALLYKTSSNTLFTHEEYKQTALDIVRKITNARKEKILGRGSG